MGLRTDLPLSVSVMVTNCPGTLYPSSHRRCLKSVLVVEFRWLSISSPWKSDTPTTSVRSLPSKDAALLASRSPKSSSSSFNDARTDTARLGARPRVERRARSVPRAGELARGPRIAALVIPGRGRGSLCPLETRATHRIHEERFSSSAGPRLLMCQPARRATPPGAHGDAMRGSGTPGECARIPDATCGRLDDGAELWGPAALARAQTRDATTPLSEETGLMRELRKKSGPFASDATLRAHLRAARGKLHWSMNGYFRQAVLDADPRAKCDFEPRPLASDRPAVEPARGVSSSTTTTTTCREADVPRLPPLVWELILARVPAVDACRLARVSSSTRDAARALRVASPIRLPMGRRRRVSRCVLARTRPFRIGATSTVAATSENVR